MISKPLSKAQQRVMDWLAESPDRCIYELHSNCYRLMLICMSSLGEVRYPGYNEIKGICNSRISRSLVAKKAVAEVIINGRRCICRRYIHPKFAGGTDDPAN